MKKYLQLLSFCLIANFVMAQTIQVDPLLVTEWEQGDLGDADRVGHATMTNTSNEEKTFTWVRDIVCNSAEFSVQYCDKNGCYFPGLGDGDITLAPGESSTMDIHANTNGVTGVELVVKITLTDIGDSTNTITGTFEYEACSTTSLDEDVQLAKEITLFPNPVTDNFYLSENTVVENVVVYNILGSAVKRFSASTSGVYEIADLNAGIYLVQLVGENNELLRTMKISKR